ncbi:MAG: NAD(P)H-binding protein [bacterium]|nr:NAD(P)H-binding protein [bacterium]
MNGEGSHTEGTGMNVVIFGATGMVGRGVLLESLDDTRVQRVVVVGRRSLEIDHPKLREIIHRDFENFTEIADDLRGLDACFWCLGVSAAGLDEAKYTTITHDYTLAAARVLQAENPKMRFCFVSGSGADETEQSSMMWARIKGKTENALREVGFSQVVVFRPAFIRAMRGSKPRGALIRVAYAVFGAFGPIIRVFGGATSTVEIGKAMVAVAAGASAESRLDSTAINQLAT